VSELSAHVRKSEFDVVIVMGEDPNFRDSAASRWGDPRTLMQNALLGLGYSRHGAELLTLEDYNVLDGSRFWTCAARRRSVKELQTWPVEVVKQERDLHMDMFLEGGRRSDAHMVRYSLAAKYVSPTDRVLDAACGLGYGIELIRRIADPTAITGADISQFACDVAATHLLHVNDQVICTDVTHMPLFEDGQFDFIASFETVEHVFEPEKLMAEFRRVLRKGGQLMASVPHMWVDETGQDPNPDHHHVFDWERFLMLVQSSGFKVTRLWSQYAGGSIKSGSYDRYIAEVAIGALPKDTEWCLVLAELTA
jgi:ubiquinone/menaquinone biosynthesis C-methylase UbiE